MMAVKDSFGAVFARTTHILAGESPIESCVICLNISMNSIFFLDFPVTVSLTKTNVINVDIVD